MRAAITNVWKVGELAKLTGLTVRTLHFYDQMGLLTPSDRTEGGHRLYTEQDLARLQQILSLRSLGFSVEQTKEFLDGAAGAGHSAAQVIHMHMEQLRAQIDTQMQLYRRLEQVAETIQHRGDIPTDQLIYVLEGIRMSEKHPFTEEQMEKIKKQGELLGPEKIKGVELEWPQLIEQVKSAMNNGTPPDGPEVQALARRWRALIEMFTGGDKGIEGTLQKRYTEEPGYGAQFGMDQALMEYVGKAMRSLLG